MCSGGLLCISHFVNEISKGTPFQMLIEHVGSLFDDMPIFLLAYLTLVGFGILINSGFLCQLSMFQISSPAVASLFRIVSFDVLKFLM